MERKFLVSIVAFAALFALACFTLTGPIRLATLLILGMFALKTVLAELRKRLD
jgi:hypothetical protein